MRALFSVTNFRFFLGGVTLVELADGLRSVVIILWVYQVSQGNGLAVAAFTAADLLPRLIFGPLLGAMADRYPRRKLLIGAEAVRMGVAIGQVVAVTFGSLGALWVLVGLSSAADVLSASVRGAMLPQIVTKDLLQQANAVVTTVRQGALMTGPPLGALVFTKLGAVAAFAFDAVFFAASALLATGLHGLPKPEGSSAQPRLLAKAAAGWRYVAGYPPIRLLFLISLLSFIGAGINNTAMVFFISRTLGHDPADIAWLAVANGLVQMLMGGYLAVAAKQNNPHQVLLFGVGLMALGGVVVALAPSLVVLIMGVVITSVGNAPFNIGLNTLLQLRADPSYLGRIQAFTVTLGNGLFLAAAGASGLLVNLAEPRLVLVISALVGLCAWLLALAFNRGGSGDRS